MTSEKKIIVSKNGPYKVSGSIPLSKEKIVSDEAGNSVEWKKTQDYPANEEYSLCRCGRSAGKPFCDSSHIRGFDGTETASRKTYEEQDKKVEGATVDLTDTEELCAAARFCHNKHGRIWNLVKDSKNDSVVRNQAFRCPSGRLVLWDKYGRAIEPNFGQSISLIEDTVKGVSGPLWVKGGVSLVSSDGHVYERRNRVTLCRCGKSNNKPFCDCTHIETGFDDGDESLSR